MCNMSFGDTSAVARAKELQCTVGNVAMAPLDSEYGKGHIRIMTRSFIPSCFNVRASAAKRLSLAINRWTMFFKMLRERRNDAVLPATVALAAINHLHVSAHNNQVREETPTRWETHKQNQPWSSKLSILLGEETTQRISRPRVSSSRR